MKALQKRKKEEGLKEQNSGYTFTQVSEIYLTDKNFKKRSPTTIQGYRQLLNNWILPEIGDIKLRNIEESDLENLYAKMKNSKNSITGKPLSYTYITHVHKLIKSIYNYAKKKKWILSNPTDYVINPPTPKIVERDYYSFEEMMEVFEKLEDCPTRFKTAIFLIFNSGFRRGELIGLKWKDINVKSSPKIIKGKRVLKKRFYVSVHREVERVTEETLKKYIDKDLIIEKLGKGLICKKLKTKKSERTISIIEQAYNYLMEYKQEQIERGFNPTDNDYIFRTLDCDGIWDPNYLTKDWASFVKTNALKSITLHDIRHSHATYLLSLGVPVQDVSRRLGHSEPTTTLKVYTHSNLTQDERITDYMEIVINNQSSSNYDKFIEPTTKETKENLLSIYSIVTGINLIDMDNIYKSLDILLDNPVDSISLPSAISIARNYLFEQYPELKGTASLINSLDSNQLDLYVDNLCTILDGTFYDLKPIKNIEKYTRKTLE